MQNAIGQFEFLGLAGSPDQLKKRLVIETRPGVDGVGLWEDSSRGHPFTLRSQVDAASVLAARAMYGQYCGLIGGDPVELSWWGISLSGERFKVCVLNVEQVRLTPLLGCSGGLNLPSRAYLECDWSLIAISI